MFPPPSRAAFDPLSGLQQHDDIDYRRALFLIYGGTEPPSNIQIQQAKAALEHSYALYGNPDAAYLLGTLWEKSTLKDHEKRLHHWYLKAAQANHPEAQLRLALLYHTGTTVTQSNHTAMQWIQKSARQQHAPALYYWGLSELEGWIHEPNPILAAAHFEQAKENYPPARYNLALLYANGNGIEKNLIKACTELDVLSHQEHPLASSAKQLRNILFLDMSHEAIEQALTAAHRLLHRKEKQPSHVAPLITH